MHSLFDNTKSLEMQWAGKSALLVADEIMGAALDENDCNMGEVFGFFVLTLYDCAWHCAASGESVSLPSQIGACNILAWIAEKAELTSTQ